MTLDKDNPLPKTGNTNKGAAHNALPTQNQQGAKAQPPAESAPMDSLKWLLEMLEELLDTFY